MNGEMFEADSSPAGRCVVNGKTITRHNTRAGEGNFHLKPNGFCAVQDGKAFVCETTAAVDTLDKTNFFTWCGPMLVNGGEVHPAFGINSPNRQFRNAVSIRKDGAVCLAISEERHFTCKGDFFP